MSEDDSPIAKLVNLILHEAVKAGASELHLTPEEAKLTVRHLLGGSLHDVMQPPVKLGPALVSRLKSMADLELAERARQQMGGFTIRIGNGEELDFAVVVSPTPFGEKVIVRRVARGAPPWPN